MTKKMNKAIFNNRSKSDIKISLNNQQKVAWDKAHGIDPKLSMLPKETKNGNSDSADNPVPSVLHNEQEEEVQGHDGGTGEKELERIPNKEE